MGNVLRRVVVGLSALLVLVGCGGDASPELTEALDEAGFEEDDFDADELAEAEELLDDIDTELEKPDDFPDEIPLPDDARVVASHASSIDDGRVIEIQFAWPGEMDEWIQRYADELPGVVDVEEEGIAESEEQTFELGGGLYDNVWARWDFSGLGWEQGTLYVLDAEAHVESVAEAWGIGEEWGEDQEERFERDIVIPFEGTQVSAIVRLREQALD